MDKYIDVIKDVIIVLFFSDYYVDKKN